MRVYDVSTKRRVRHEQQINWSRQLTFSPRQSRFVLETITAQRGVYCIYAKDYLFSYDNGIGRKHWSSVVYIGSGYLSERLACHLRYGKNDVLVDFVSGHDLAYRYAVINDHDETLDYPRSVEAVLLKLFKQKFGSFPPANRRDEFLPYMNCDEFILSSSSNFDPLAYGS